MLPGMQVMLASLRRHGNVGRTPVLLLTADAQVRNDPLLRQLADEVRHIRISEYPASLPDQQHWGIASYIKGFEAFRDYGADVNVLLDADLLCTGDISALLTPTRYHIRGVPDGVANRLAGFPGGGYVEINTGVLVIARSVQGDLTVSELLAGMRQCQTTGIADQGVINVWAYRRNLTVDLLPLIYNFYWGAFPGGRPRYRFWDAASHLRHEARLIHFSHAVKPWHTEAPADCPAVRLWREYYAALRARAGEALPSVGSELPHGEPSRHAAPRAGGSMP